MGEAKASVVDLDVDVDDGEEPVFNCVDEANAIINDVKAHVAEIAISGELPSDAAHIYMNIRTIEGATCCVQVTSRGFKIVSSSFDTIDEDAPLKAALSEQQQQEQQQDAEDEPEEIYETPYALLDKISPRYVESFGNKLCQQLRQLQQMRTEFNEEDEEEDEENEAVD